MAIRQVKLVRMAKYKYTGEVEVVINGVGVVKPGDEVDTKVEINHPDFEEVSKSKKKEEDKEE